MKVFIFMEIVGRGYIILRGSKVYRREIFFKCILKIRKYIVSL